MTDLTEAAFDHLLDCAASAQPKEACVNGWMKNAEPFLKHDDPKFTRAMLDYYVTSSLRGDSR